MYGPTKCFMTIHVEVDSKGDIIETHDKIDEIETSVAEKFNVNLTIHMDPVIIGDPEIDNIKEIVNDYLHSINPTLKSHDLRLVKKNVSTVIFDIEVAYDDTIDVVDLETQIMNVLKEKTDKKYNVIINVDHSYTD
jgi:divalent metal cation (Fe/Co/Zn/Cd) transporter